MKGSYYCKITIEGQLSDGLDPLTKKIRGRSTILEGWLRDRSEVFGIIRQIRDQGILFTDLHMSIKRENNGGRYGK
jgi:hypothetical protein